MHSFFLFYNKKSGAPQFVGGINMKKLKCASFFAGVGGIDLGFKNAEIFETVYLMNLRLKHTKRILILRSITEILI